MVDILDGLINILNYCYIDIQPHFKVIYPCMVKIVNKNAETGNLEIEKSISTQIKTFIPLDKLNLILCISLYILYNLKNGKIRANSANINLIHNLICFRLYNNVVYDDMSDYKNQMHHPIRINLKEEVIKSIRKFEGLQNSKNNEDEDVINKLINLFVDRATWLFRNYWNEVYQL